MPLNTALFCPSPIVALSLSLSLSLSFSLSLCGDIRVSTNVSRLIEKLRREKLKTTILS